MYRGFTFSMSGTIEIPREIFQRVRNPRYILLCGILLLAFGYMLLGIISSPGTGWDYRVYMGAVNALNQNKDPYILDNIKDYVGDTLPFTYAPHTLLFFGVLFLFPNIGIFYLLLIILMLISTYLVLTMDQKPHYLFLGTLLLTGFISAYWNFLTGNIHGIFFLFLLAGSMYLLKQERFYVSAIVIGLMSSWSLFPIIFSAVFLVIKRPLVERFKLICLSCGTSGTILVLSFIVNPPLMQSFIQSLTASTSAIHDSGGMATPLPYLMFGDIAKGLYLGSPVFSAILSIMYICLVIGAANYFIKKNQENLLKIYSFVFLSIFMLLPRIKPYYFIMLVVPLYFLVKDYSYKAKLLVFTGISLFPLFVYLNYWVNPKLVPDMVNLYAQTMSLFFIFGFIILYDRYAPASS